MKHEFKIISGWYDETDQSVTAFLNEGWQLAGPLVVAGEDEKPVFHQPMVRAELEDHEKELIFLRESTRIMDRLLAHTPMPDWPAEKYRVWLFEEHRRQLEPFIQRS